MELKDIIIDSILLNDKLKNSIITFDEFRDDLSLTVKKEELLDFSNFLFNCNELQFIICRDVTAVDWAKSKERFTVVYNLYSFLLNKYLRLKVILDGLYPEVESVCSVWKSADWYERETYDMYGLKFLNHPDLRRMYMPEEFEYYPLRKEFPVMGIPGSLPLPEMGD
ncbi:MAG: NADH-quinone oxidoreductase subunit C [bacterium]